MNQVDFARELGFLQQDMRETFAQQARGVKELEERMWERFTAMEERTDRLLEAVESLRD